MEKQGANNESGTTCSDTKSKKPAAHCEGLDDGAKDLLDAPLPAG